MANLDFIRNLLINKKNKEEIPQITPILLDESGNIIGCLVYDKNE